MDREPQVRRLDDEIIATGVNRLGAKFFRGYLRPLLGVPRHVERLHVLPSLAARREFFGVTLEVAVANRRGVETRTDSQERLRYQRAVCCRQRLDLAPELKSGRYESDARHLERGFVRREQQRDLLFDRDVDRDHA